MQGWIKLWRKVGKKWYYAGNRKRPFTRWEAIIDLWLFRAAGIDNGRVRRGQILTTENVLSRDWHWNRWKVHRFLKRLAADKEIEILPQKAGGRTEGLLITICNYELYNPFLEEENSAPSTAPSTAPSEPQSLLGFHGNGAPSDAPSGAPSTAPPSYKKTKVKRKLNYTPEFASFWKEYPMKVDKAYAFKAWEKLEKELLGAGESIVTVLSQIMEGLQSWKVSRKWTKDNGEYICHASTFINRKRWESAPDPEGAERPDEAPNWG